MVKHLRTNEQNRALILYKNNIQWIEEGLDNLIEIYSVNPL